MQLNRHKTGEEKLDPLNREVLAVRNSAAMNIEVYMNWERQVVRRLAARRS
jgi:hypothetical protein